MNSAQMKAYLKDGGLNARLTYIYGEAALEAQKARYAKAIDEFAAIYGADREISLYSVVVAEASVKSADYRLGNILNATAAVTASVTFMLFDDPCGKDDRIDYLDHRLGGVSRTVTGIGQAAEAIL